MGVRKGFPRRADTFQGKLGGEGAGFDDLRIVGFPRQDVEVDGEVALDGEGPLPVGIVDFQGFVGGVHQDIVPVGRPRSVPGPEGERPYCVHLEGPGQLLKEQVRHRVPVQHGIGRHVDIPVGVLGVIGPGKALPDVPCAGRGPEAVALLQRLQPLVHAVVVQNDHLLRDRGQVRLRQFDGRVLYAFHGITDISIRLHDVLVRIAAQVFDNRSSGIHFCNVHLICPAAGDPHSLAHKNRLVHRPGTHLRVHLPQACVKASHLIFQVKGLSIQLVVHRLRQRPDPFVHVVVLPDHHLFRNQR